MLSGLELVATVRTVARNIELGYLNLQSCDYFHRRLNGAPRLPKKYLSRYFALSVQLGPGCMESTWPCQFTFTRTQVALGSDSTVSTFLCNMIMRLHQKYIDFTSRTWRSGVTCSPCQDLSYNLSRTFFLPSFHNSILPTHIRARIQ